MSEKINLATPGPGLKERRVPYGTDADQFKLQSKKMRPQSASGKGSIDKILKTQFNQNN